MFKMSYLQIFFVVFFGETNFFEGQLIVTYSVVQSLLSVQCIKTVQWPKHSTHSLLFLFLSLQDQIFCITDQDYGRDLLGGTDSFMDQL